MLKGKVTKCCVVQRGGALWTSALFTRSVAFALGRKGSLFLKFIFYLNEKIEAGTTVVWVRG